nr:uncharacterized protein LOC112708272 [Arachis hypogaea]
MSTEDRKSLTSFLQENANLFAWTSADMPGIDPSIITHKLALNPAARPISQKKRNLGTEKRQASIAEVQKLINANFIREIRFTTWLANVVMVRKSNGATYQRLMNKIFQQQIGRNIEVYVDDMVAKTKLGDSHIQDLAEIFGQIRRYNMRLNPEKCAFGVQGGKFLGFILTSRGIEANPEKCQAILTMQSPSTVKENFFQNPPVLQKPKSGEPLYIYLSITDASISSALVTETDRNQQPVYFVSKSLQNAELRYPRLEKLALALVFSSRRLRPYFQSHTIIVRTGQPLRQVLSKPELAGRLIKWAIELSEFDIQYQPRGSVKSQYLVDFVAELTEPCSDASSPTWTLFVDGASNPQGAGAGILLENSDGIVLEHSLRFSFKASNNQSEYEALIAGLRLATDLHIDNLRVYCDSLLVVQQVKHSFQTKDPILLKYLDIVHQLLQNFSTIHIIHIPREQNHRADILSKLATTQAHTTTLLQSTLDKPSIDTHNVLSIVNKDNWQHPYIQYLRSGTIPNHIDNKGKFRRQASYYTLLNDNLYRRGYSRPLLKCLNRAEADLVLSEAHEGICGIHSGARSLSQKILRAGFYWPTIWKDSKHKVRTCDNCQKHSPTIHLPAEHLHHLTVSWTFEKWGIDILGPFPTAPRQVKYLVVAIDYFSKWIEAQPLAKITSAQMISFVWKNIICRFGIPNNITTDNGRQFIDQSFKAFLQNLKIKQHFSSVEHPQSNGLAEDANKVILQALRKKLDNAKGLWAELVPEVLWAYNTTAHSTTKESPFRLVYRSEAMIPIEVSHGSMRTLAKEHDQARQAELDLIEEIRETAAIRHRALQQQLSRRYGQKVKPRSFNTGDLVLRKTEQARRPPSHGKLAATWDGPYRISEVLGRGAYKLEDLNGTKLPSTWNVGSLKRYYS